VADESETQETAEQESEETQVDEHEPETFPAQVVKDLRKENAKYRTAAKKSDDYARRLHTELVRATGRLADPTDVEFSEEHLDDPEKLTAAIDSLLEAKPYLKSRKVAGDVAQGKRGNGAAPADFSQLFAH
jgi:hypothetical protein